MSNHSNKLIVNKFKELIELLKIEVNLIYDQENKTINEFRVDALERNCNYISKMPSKITNSNDVKNIKGFGKGTLARVQEILNTGSLKEITNMKRKIKKMFKIHLLVEELSNVIGIGSITAIKLINQWKITSLKEFKKRVKNKEIQVNDKIALGLKYEGKFEKTIPRKYIEKVYSKIKKSLSINSIVCGSFRRGYEKSHDIDLLLWDESLLTQNDVRKSDKLSKCIKKLKKSGIVTDDITSDKVKTKYMGFCTHKNKLYRLDVRLIAFESLYTAIAYFTGSYETNIKMRNRAKKLALKLSEYGLFNVMGNKLSVDSEEHLFQRLRMKYLEPHER
jgi:DNA polymerase/3'-5' exonuclease PolX